MSRALFLPTIGDPFISGLWISSYKKYVQKHFDKIYVYLNSGVDQPVFDYVKAQFESLPGSKVLTARSIVDHGVGITTLLNECNEDYVFIAEDDFYVLRPYFESVLANVESGRFDAIASPRGSCGLELHNAIVNKFNLIGPDAMEPNFWPCLFYSHVDVLRNSDKNFSSTNFKKGVPIPILDYTPTDNTSGDTFVWFSIQLRQKGYRIRLYPQYRLTVGDTTVGQYPWVHLGSSSSGFNGGLLDKEDYALGLRHSCRTKFGLPTIAVDDDGLTKDWARRLAYWRIARDWFPIMDHDASYFNAEYISAIERMFNERPVSRDKYNQYKSLYETILLPIRGA